MSDLLLKLTSTHSPDDIVIISALRTAIGKARRGVFKDTFVEDLLSPVIKATIERTRIDPATLGDIAVGTVLGQNVQRANECRMAMLLADVPASVPLHILNRQCSSGLQAVATVAAAIRAGHYDIGLACGVESMSAGSLTAGWVGPYNPRIFMTEQAKACLLPMGITSENVATRYGVDRKSQDEFSAASHAKAADAIKSGRFKEEIVPVSVKIKDEKTGVERVMTVDTDDGVRADTTPAGLAKLKPAFQAGGTTTAGNSSQVSDGAAAVLVTTRRYADQHKLPHLGILRAFAVVGVPPDVMGIGPVFAIPAVLKKAKLSVDDIGLYELNEAFASQALYTVRTLNLPIERVNVNGGAIALGHPLGCTGARQTATILHEMKRRKVRFGVVSMCIGSGMGAAAVYELDVKTV